MRCSAEWRNPSAVPAPESFTPSTPRLDRSARRARRAIRPAPSPVNSRDEPERGAQTGEQQAFGEELSREPQPRGVEAEPDAQLAAPRRRAGVEQVRDVRARDQQDERDDGHDDGHRPTVALPKA